MYHWNIGILWFAEFKQITDYAIRESLSADCRLRGGTRSSAAVHSPPPFYGENDRRRSHPTRMRWIMAILSIWFSFTTSRIFTRYTYLNNLYTLRISTIKFYVFNYLVLRFYVQAIYVFE